MIYSEKVVENRSGNNANVTVSKQNFPLSFSVLVMLCVRASPAVATKSH